MVELEKNIHASFDEHLFYAQKTFYIFRLKSKSAKRRIDKLLKKPLTVFTKRKLLINQFQSIKQFEGAGDQSIMDSKSLLDTVKKFELDNKRQFDLIIKEALSYLERISPFHPLYIIENDYKSSFGRGFAWMKRTILRMIFRFDVSLKYQSHLNRNLVDIICRLVEKTYSMEIKCLNQECIIGDLKKKLKESA